MTGLRHVEINGNTPLRTPQVSDEGLKYLAGLNELRELTVRMDWDVNGSGLKHLGRLRHLRKLALDGTKLNDQGLKNLNAFPELAELNLCGTAITEKGIDQLAHCKRLRHLDLSNNQQLEMNEEVFKMLSRLKQLRCLNMMTTSKLALAGEKDQQLKYVTTLKHLDKLIIHRNQFTPEAVTALQSAMPHLEIAFDHPEAP